LHALLRDNAEAAIPQVVRWHFEAATALAETQQIDLRRQLRQMRLRFAEVEGPLVALKRTAYVAANLAAARGCHIDAVDLLVPRERLNDIESIMQEAGWREVELSAYERRYCRRWRQHVLQPPHAEALNLHHAILPDGARFRPDAGRLSRRAREVPSCPGIVVLAGEDNILCATTALMHDDGLANGLRDLSDLDLLLRAESAANDFWPRLLARSEEMGLERPLFYALRYARHFFATPIPDEVGDRLSSVAPSSKTLRVMDAIYTRMLAPRHRSCADTLTPLARHATYLRAHWLRRPPRQLLPHLIRKTFTAPYRREPNPA
jgi:hypothetical protein